MLSGVYLTLCLYHYAEETSFQHESGIAKRQEDEGAASQNTECR